MNADRRRKGSGDSIAGTGKRDPLLFGGNEDEGLVAVELVERRGSGDEMVLFFRRGEKTVQEPEPFEPFMVADAGLITDCPVKLLSRELRGRGELNVCASFRTWKDCLKARTWLSRKTGFSPSAPNAPYLCVNDPVQQHFLTSGRTLFLGIRFEDLRRMQVDIECFTSEGYEFCNAERKGDRIIAIALSDQSGWVEVLSGADMSEKELLERFVEIVRERDPDVLEGHNIFNFDLPYIAKRATLHGVKLSLGRNGSVPKRRASRFSVGERTISYERFDVFGRHVVDTLFMVHAYDISRRSLNGFGLKEAAAHFGFASRDRVYIEGSQISKEFARCPGRVMKYVRDDVIETRELSNLLSKSSFIQTQVLPYSYQNACVRGNATKIDALMIREYLRQRHALPMPDRVRDFAGGYTDIFVQGVVENVHHCDIRSLYPSLMLVRNLAPRNDEQGVFLKLLEALRTFRINAKEKMQKSSSQSDRTYFDALQGTFKILINSFYGYLGFAQGRFSDFSTAEEVTAQGRSLLRSMISWLRDHGATPVEIDTDGIYYVPPPQPKGSNALDKDGMASFRNEFAESLPDGMEIEFDGEYRCMFSYKMKNYALLTKKGDMIIKGAALKSRGLEPFQKSFLREILRMKLTKRKKDIPALKVRYETAIRGRQWAIAKLAKTEILQDAPATYAAKIGEGRRSKSAVYELALRSTREYRAGDQLSYYVTGDKKNVTVHQNAKAVSEWDPKARDENIEFYVAKLDALCRKFCSTDGQAGFDANDNAGKESKGKCSHSRMR